METLPEGGGTVLPSTGEFISRHELNKQLDEYRKQMQSMKGAAPKTKQAPRSSSTKRKK